MTLLHIAALVAGAFIAASIAGHCMMKNDEKSKKTFDEFSEELSSKIDKYIVDKSEELNMKYVSGKCAISVNDCVCVNSKLYFSDDSENLKEVTLEYKVKTDYFSSDSETQQKLDDLKINSLIFDVIL